MAPPLRGGIGVHELVESCQDANKCVLWPLAPPRAGPGPLERHEIAMSTENGLKTRRFLATPNNPWGSLGQAWVIIW